MTTLSARPRPPTHEGILAPLPFHLRMEAARRARNPLLEAAQVLLDALAHTPAELNADEVVRWREGLACELRIFGKLCAELRLRPDHVRDARYCLCAALDEVAMQKDWGQGGATTADWSSNCLAVEFGLDRQGADGVFRIGGQAMLDPHEHRYLIEVIRHILDVGFKGRYRFEPDGQRKLAAVRERGYGGAGAHHVNPEHGASVATVAGSKPEPQTEAQVSYEMTSTVKKRRRPWLIIGPLIVVTIAIAVTFAALAGAGYTFQKQSIRDRPAVDTRTAAHTAPSVHALTGKLEERLHNAIAAGVVDVDENASQTAVTLRFRDMFARGEVSVNALVSPFIAVAGQELAGASGQIHLTATPTICRQT
jgi:type VI secretion system protein ImpK